jgi:ParB/RepB/Spo0J family partition protein
MQTALVEDTNSEMDSDRSFTYLSILGRAKSALDSAVDIVVDVSEIRRYENQPRKYFNPVGIRSLSDSIAAGGQVVAGLIRRNPAETEYELIDGERRWRAVSAIREQYRPLYKAKLIDADDDVVQFLISGVANFNREGHTVLETMETITRLLEFEFPMEEIAIILGISTVWAYQIHGLTKLTPKVLELLDPSLPKKKQLPVTAAIQISKIEGRFQLQLAERVINRDVSLARLRTEVVKVAKDAGSPIRIREVDPRKKLESLLNKAQVLERTALDLKNMVADPELKRHMKARPQEARRVSGLLKLARAAIFDCEERLKVSSQE